MSRSGSTRFGVARRALAALAAGGAIMAGGVAAAAPTAAAAPAVMMSTCGDHRETKTSGGEAYWELSCSGGVLTVSGWVKDTDADGQCAKVEAEFSNGDVLYSNAACPKGEVEQFKLSARATSAEVRLFEYNASE